MGRRSRWHDDEGGETVTGPGKYSFLLREELHRKVLQAAREKGKTTLTAVFDDVLTAYLDAYLADEPPARVERRLELSFNAETYDALVRGSNLLNVCPASLVQQIVTEQLPSYLQMGYARLARLHDGEGVRPKPRAKRPKRKQPTREDP